MLGVGAIDDEIVRHTFKNESRILKKDRGDPLLDAGVA